MEIKSISGYTCFVKDLDTTAKFYEDLGFRSGKQETDQLTVYINWFSVQFRMAPRGATYDNEKSGLLVNLKVSNVDEFYKGITTKGMKPESGPEDQPSGSREFMLHDPDGYKLVFFEKK